MVDSVEIAKDYVLHTKKHVFLTGKAGTGKTTFLRDIQKNSRKKMVTTAPTGVAAINAGGMTLHSFFQLPFGMFVPEEIRSFDDNVQIVTPNSMFQNLKLSKAKKDTIRELDLLIIDEVSMLRCDTLDCIDIFLKHIRGNLDEAFGGVQVLFIGDLYQLPPVVKDENWNILSQYYDTPFFFSAKVLEQADIKYIELETVYRQSDQTFIDLLNHVRNNEMNENDFDLLNQRYQPDSIYGLENYITLCTHNWKADKINLSQLQRLEADEVQFPASIWGEFSDRNYPTENNLILKQGAQIMFIKNDTSADKKYYNGKLATIKRIYSDEIVVNFFDTRDEFVVKKETWKNIRYQFNPGADKIEEEEIGAFTQYPIKLAWAVTIHKSQGLTFEKAVIDAGQSFAAGQVYVALSRCTTLEGMYLLTPIHADAIMTEPQIIRYTKENIAKKTKYIQELNDAKNEYSKLLLLKAFDWTKVFTNATELKELVSTKNIPNKENAISLATSIIYKVHEQREIADKFLIQLKNLLSAPSDDLLVERLKKAIEYFGKTITQDIIEPLHAHIEDMKSKTRVKKYLEELLVIEKIFYNKLSEIEKMKYNGIQFYDGPTFYNNKKLLELEQKSKQKVQKGDSSKESLILYNTGKSIIEIAQIRSLSTTTIEGHLAQYIASGDVKILDFFSTESLEKALSIINKNKSTYLTELKAIVGNDYSFGQLRMAIAYNQSLKTSN